MSDDWKKIEFPDQVEAMIKAWAESEEQTIGVCLLCGQLIRTEDDLLPGTSIHRCVELDSTA